MMQFKFVLNARYNERKFAFSCMWFLLLAHADFRMPSWHRRKYTIVEVKTKNKKQKTPLFGYWKIYLSSFDLFPLWATYIMKVWPGGNEITYMKAPSMLPSTWQALSKYYRYYTGESSKNKWTLVFLYPGRPAGNICCSSNRCSPAIFLIFFKHLTFFSSQLL